ncbi:MAG: hypothetical protein MUE99_00395 [Chitinophagaceae bacterium]|jgi:hypothetical protein|nr:hypothetical protein [Chitinophagaceae bacterium]
MRKWFALLCLAIGFTFPDSIQAQAIGCTDPQALNFDSLAIINNGSCVYSNTQYVPTQKTDLPGSLLELSGLVYWNEMFWGHNDGGNGPWLYAIDTLSGAIKKVVGLMGADNVDWEDIAQDSLHIYVGDFGNNASGNRRDLTIYKIEKQYLISMADTVLLRADQYAAIRFSYPDQVDFSSSAPNQTRFDCEAMFFHRDSLHVITKNWVGDYSVHYSIPTDSGVHVAVRHDSLATNGFLITAADVGADDQLILTAYNRSGSCVFYLIYGFDKSINFFETGNKRRINLPSSLNLGQLESVCFINGIRGAIGSERFIFSVINVSENIRRFTTQQWVFDHYKRNSPAFAEPGMLRYNTESQTFEYFDGIQWLNIAEN